MDLYIYDRGYFHRIQNELLRIEVHLLYTCITYVEGTYIHQFVGLIEPNAAMGIEVDGDFAKSTLCYIL